MTLKLLLFAIMVGALLFWALRRGHPAPGHRTASPPSSTMSDGEAMKVLGLEGSPGREEVIEAHRRLMQKVHPDHGGSTYLAQQLNEAKRVLLARR